MSGKPDSRAEENAGFALPSSLTEPERGPSKAGWDVGGGSDGIGGRKSNGRADVLP
jgi:hypothetical protein